MSELPWHDIECGGYTADLELWRELAAREAGPVLDVGAGSGRVTLDLAARGHAVTALDIDAELIAELSARADRAGLQVPTAVADAAGFELPGAPFGLILVPMQTIQMLPGRSARAAFLASARDHLADRGLLAMTLSEHLRTFEADPEWLPLPDTGERDGARYASFPLAIRERGDVVLLERMRQLTAPDGSTTVDYNTVEMARLTAAGLEAEVAEAGLRPESRVEVPETELHLGATMVTARG